MDEALIVALEDDEVVPSVAEDVFLAPMTILVGDVRLGARSNVWYGSVIRADSDPIEVGEDCNVQDGCVLHSDPGFPVRLGDRVSLGHGAIVHGATVEHDCLIGMRAVVLNGAVVGAGSLVAAGAVVRPGMEVPPGSMVAGVPAEVRREVTDAERETLARTPRSYADRAARYRAVARRRAEPRPRPR